MEDVEGEALSEATISYIDEQRATCESVLEALKTSAQDLIKACQEELAVLTFDMQIMN